MNSPQTLTAPRSTARSGSLYLALAPWVLFSVIAHGSVQVASLVALLAAAVIAAPAVLAGKPKLLELGAVVTFAGFSALVLDIDPGAAHTLSLYARGIAAGVLSLIVFGSLLFTPFTEQYARERVDAQFWNTPVFKATNRRLTAMWGAVFAAMVPLHIIAGTVDTQRSNLVFNWLLPVLLVM